MPSLESVNKFGNSQLTAIFSNYGLNFVDAIILAKPNQQDDAFAIALVEDSQSNKRVALVFIKNATSLDHAHEMIYILTNENNNEVQGFLNHFLAHLGNPLVSKIGKYNLEERRYFDHFCDGFIVLKVIDVNKNNIEFSAYIQMVIKDSGSKNKHEITIEPFIISQSNLIAMQNFLQDHENIGRWVPGVMA